MRSFRPLLWFWLCVLAFFAAGAATLQIMGPPHRPTAATATSAPKPTPIAPAPTPPPAPTAIATQARVPPSRPDPAPPLKMRLGAIPEPDPALLEASIFFTDRFLPRADNAGRTPATLYAAAFDPAERHPRVTVVIDGAGLDRALTAQANRTLPAAIDFAFSPYAPPAAANRLASDARRVGRECLVSIPMEPNGYPANDEGERALLTGSDPAQLRQNLEWSLASVQGCVGATGALDGMGGERFAESPQSLGDLLTFVAQRGLLYLDPRPGAPLPPDSGAGRRLPYVADLVLDHGNAPDHPAEGPAIDQNLARLEAIAARSGGAIGIAGPPTPVLLDRLSVWAHGLAGRGFVLAPLTAEPAPQPPAMEPPAQ